MLHAPTLEAPAAAKSVYLKTFGCQMNVLDSQLVRGQLQSLGYRFTDDWRSADVILYNTCSVREHAEQKVWSRVGEVGVHKRDHPHVVLGVIGCMAERDGIHMIRKHPQIDLLCGPGELDKVPMLVDNAIRTDLTQRGGVKGAGVALQGNTHRRSQTLAAAEDQLELLDLSRSFSPTDSGGEDAPARASQYVRITRGCNKFCTYCVVPYTRGREIHRPPDHIVDECRKLVEAGVVEITLLGQTVNHYHYDHTAAVTIRGIQQPQVGEIVHRPKSIVQSPGSRSETTDSGLGTMDYGLQTSFADLLARVHDEVPELQRLRFITSFPRDFGDDILETIAARPRLCRYLHLPVQSGSNRILKLMNRDYTVEEYRDLLDRVRRILPDAQIATDIICGFPTETEEDHRATIELLRHGRFKNAFIFKYSSRPGTTASKRFEDDVPDEIKKRRNNELLRVQSEISAAVHQEQIGRIVRVLVESVSAKVRKNANAADPSVHLAWQADETVMQLVGRTDGDLIVCFEGDASMIGCMVEVEIDRAAPLTLFGRAVV